MPGKSWEQRQEERALRRLADGKQDQYQERELARIEAERQKREKLRAKEERAERQRKARKQAAVAKKANKKLVKSVAK